MSESVEILGVIVAAEGSTGGLLLRALTPGGQSTRSPDLVLAAQLTPVPRPVPDPRVFVHHPVSAGRFGGSLLVGDQMALFRIRPDGRRIDAEIRPEALADGGSAVAALHLSVALAFALRHHGVFHMHAAVLADGERAIVVAGQAGAGKTTLAMAFLEAGLDWVCDDASFLAEREGAPRIEGMPRPFHLRPDTQRAFPAAAARAWLTAAPGRRELNAEAHWPGRRRCEPLRAGLLLFPEVTKRPVTAVLPLKPADALERLLGVSALLVVDGAARPAEHLALLCRLAETAPACRVELGEDLLRSPAEVGRRILSTADSLG